MTCFLFLILRLRPRKQWSLAVVNSTLRPKYTDACHAPFKYQHTCCRNEGLRKEAEEFHSIKEATEKQLREEAKYVP